MVIRCIREFMKPGSSVATEHPFVTTNESEPFVGPLAFLPRDREEVHAVFGDPGFAKPSKSYQRSRMTVARGLPGRWNKGRNKLYCHELAEPYLREALRRAELAEALAAVDKIGCYSFRHQRHDPKRPLSYHSWGIAVDIDPMKNRARKFATGLAPKPFSREWRTWWPSGISAEIVEAFESVGWTWGGRWKRFVDPMHFELVE